MSWRINQCLSAALVFIIQPFYNPAVIISVSCLKTLSGNFNMEWILVTGVAAGKEGRAMSLRCWPLAGRKRCVVCIRHHFEE